MVYKSLHDQPNDTHLDFPRRFAYEQAFKTPVADIRLIKAYPLLIIGPHAAILSSTLSQKQAFDIIVAGFAIQGTGFLVSMMIYAAFIYRLMTQKLPQERLRPGMFVSVGPSAFTVAGVIGMAQNIERALPKDLMGENKLVSTILRVIATWMSLWIWG